MNLQQVTRCPEAKVPESHSINFLKELEELCEKYEIDLTSRRDEVWIDDKACGNNPRTLIKWHDNRNEVR